MTKVWELDLKSTDKLVLLALADHANDDCECYPSLNKISNKSGLSKQGLLNSIDRLVKNGYLIKEFRNRADGSQTSNLYILKVEGGSQRGGRGVVNEVEGGSQRGGRGVVNEVDSFNHQLEPSSNHQFNRQSKNIKPDIKQGADKSDAVILPDFIKSEVWENWKKYRKERKLTCREITLKAQIEKLKIWHAKGHNVNEIIDTSIASGWQGLFEPKGKPEVNTHSGLADKNYDVKFWGADND